MHANGRAQWPLATRTFLLPLIACLSGCSPDPGPGPSPTPQSACSGLANQTYSTADGTATVTSVRLVAASGDGPEHCNVQGTLPPALVFEIKLPTTWNQRLLYIGGGGFDGAIPQPPGYQLQQNYVTVASNGGHTANGVDENWALDPVQLNDYTDRSVHKTLVAARMILHTRYGRDANRSYFEGCSNGGREALLQAQRYPEDFDGIVARAPAWNFVELMLAGNKGMQQFFASGATQLSAAKTETLSNAVLAACDGLDNALDGVVGNSAACTFNPAALRCGGTDADSCLTDAQVATVNTIYSVHRFSNGVPYYIGWPPGGESGAGGWGVWRANPNDGLPGFSTRFIRYFLQLGSTYDAMNFVPENHLPIIASRADSINADTIDYTTFRARNGKLLLWHGTNDPAISYRSTALYYNNVVTANGGQAVADQFVEFFSAPGVQHCFGGAGSDFVDLLTPLAQWVENGIPPSQQNLIAFKLQLQPTLALTNPRPLCKFPRYPRLTGSDPNSAASYTCTLP